MQINFAQILNRFGERTAVLNDRGRRYPYRQLRDMLGNFHRIGSSVYGTHTMRRTKATLIYKRTKNLRAVQLPPGHTNLESTARYLGIEVDDALDMAEQTKV